MRGGRGTCARGAGDVGGSAGGACPRARAKGPARTHSPPFIVRIVVFAGVRRGFITGRSGGKAMQDYLIERHIPGVGQLDADQLRTASAASNAALAQLAGI